MSAYTGSVPDTEPGKAWLLRAACIGMWDVMFPRRSDRADYAIGICASCPVRRACLRDALAAGDNEHGIRGGMTPTERRSLARKLARARKAPPKTAA